MGKVIIYQFSSNVILKIVTTNTLLNRAATLLSSDVSWDCIVCVYVCVLAINAYLNLDLLGLLDLLDLLDVGRQKFKVT